MKSSSKGNSSLPVLLTAIVWFLASGLIARADTLAGGSLLDSERLAREIEKAPVFGEGERQFDAQDCVVRRFNLNTLIAGVLDSSDCLLTGGSYADFWQFSGTAGVRVTVTFSASVLGDTLVAIQRASDGTVLSYATGINQVAFSYTLPATQEYVIGITPFASFRTGSYNFRVDVVSGPPPPPPPSANCVISSANACLSAGRFRVGVTWRVPSQGTSGNGTATHITSDTAYFWFFNSSNIELVVKVLDARSINGRFWVFYGALSDVEYTITVTDTQAGVVKTYFNPSGQQASVGDTSAF